MTQNREPKGTKDGGKFAASSNPESTVVLADVTPNKALYVTVRD